MVMMAILVVWPIMTDRCSKCYISSFIAIGPLVQEKIFIFFFFFFFFFFISIYISRQPSWSWDQTDVNKVTFPCDDEFSYEIWFQMV